MFDVQDFAHLVDERVRVDFDQAGADDSFGKTSRKHRVFSHFDICHARHVCGVLGVHGDGDGL